MSDQEQSLEQEILADARRRAERSAQRAQRDAERVLKEARAGAKAERNRLMQAARQRADRDQKMQQARLGQEIQRLRRQAFQDVLDAVRADAERELADLAGTEEAREVLVRLAVRAIDAMRGDTFGLTLRPQDAERWGADLAEEVRAAAKARLGRTVSVEVADTKLAAKGGLVVHGEGTRQLADQTFEARLHRLWGEARARVAEMLNHVWDGINGASD